MLFLRSTLAQRPPRRHPRRPQNARRQPLCPCYGPVQVCARLSERVRRALVLAPRRLWPVSSFQRHLVSLRRNGARATSLAAEHGRRQPLAVSAPRAAGGPGGSRGGRRVRIDGGAA